MKLTIEQQDIDDVRKMAKSQHGLILTDEQARALIERDQSLAVELFEGSDDLDEVLGRTLVNALKMVDGRGLRVAWPTHGDTEEYKREFDRVFYARAREKGYEVAE